MVQVTPVLLMGYNPTVTLSTAPILTFYAIFLHANVNWFTKLVADDEGGLHFDAAHRAPGRFVDLRFDMHALVIVSAAMHPLDPRTTWDPSPIALTAWRCGLAPVDDLCRNFRGENQRAFENTERYFAA
jgi:uncharacterized protein YcgI (DUF1989 family)